MTTAKRNARRPPPGWEVFPQWIARGPMITGKGEVQQATAGDGELFESREDAVLAAWDEYEATEDSDADHEKEPR